jgi:hypothetical protein
MRGLGVRRAAGILPQALAYCYSTLNKNQRGSLRL